jgi:hypothetical protein
MTTANEFMTGFKARHAAPKVKRVSAKQQVKEARQKLLDEIMQLMRDKKRGIPKDWERGFNAAMSVIGEIK